MESGRHAVITLFFAVTKASAKSCDSRNELPIRERGIIRRAQLPIRKLTLLITLFF